MISLKKFYNWYLDLGLEYVLDQRERRYIRILNFMCLFIAISDVFTAVISCLIGIYFYTVVLVFSIIGFGVLIPALNYNNFTKLSRFLFSFFGACLMFIVSVYFGEKSYAHVVLFVISASTFCIVSPKDFKLWMFFVLFPILDYFLIFYFQFSNAYIPKIDPMLLENHIETVKDILWLFTFLFITAITFFFTWEAQQFEARLSKANRQIDMLVAILSHDLSGSLTAIQLGVELVSENDFDKNILQNKKIIERVKINIKNIYDIITHVTKMRKLAIGLESPEKEFVLLDVCLIKLNDIFFAKLESKKITLNFIELESIKNLKTIANSVVLVNEIFANIISNAIKFSEVGSKIDIFINRKINIVEIKFRDYGIGMPISIKNDLFAVEKKTSRLGTSGEKGTGFGMPLCKNYCDLFQISLQVETIEQKDSPTDHGTSFILTFKIV